MSILARIFGLTDRSERFVREDVQRREALSDTFTEIKNESDARTDIARLELRDGVRDIQASQRRLWENMDGIMQIASGRTHE